MPVEFDAIAAWTLVAECPIPNDIGPILIPGEQPYVAYKTFRDSAIFTDRRLIVRDSQGITGKKVELYSLPYSRIDMWSSENAGHLDFNAKMKLWTRTGHIKIKLYRRQPSFLQQLSIFYLFLPLTLNAIRRGTGLFNAQAYLHW